MFVTTVSLTRSEFIRSCLCEIGRERPRSTSSHTTFSASPHRVPSVPIVMVILYLVTRFNCARSIRFDSEHNASLMFLSKYRPQSATRYEVRACPL